MTDSPSLDELLDQLQRAERIFYYRFWVKRDEGGKTYYLFKAAANRRDGSNKEYRKQAASRGGAVQAVIDEILHDQVAQARLKLGVAELEP